MTIPFQTTTRDEEEQRYRDMQARFFQQYLRQAGMPLPGSAGAGLEPGRGSDFGDTLSGSSTSALQVAQRAEQSPGFLDRMAAAYHNIGEASGMDRDELLGAARRWNIPSPESLSLEELRSRVEAARQQDLSHFDSVLPRGAVNFISEATGAGAAALGGLTQLAQNLTKAVRNNLVPPSEREWMSNLNGFSKARQFFANVEEGARQNLSPEIQDHFDALAGVASVVGTVPIGGAVFRASGLGMNAAFNGARWWTAASPLLKMGLQGAATSLAYDAGTDKPWLPASGDLDKIGQQPDQVENYARLLYGNRTGSALLGGGLAMAFQALFARAKASPATADPPAAGTALQRTTRLQQGTGPVYGDDYEYINNSGQPMPDLQRRLLGAGSAEPPSQPQGVRPVGPTDVPPAPPSPLRSDPTADVAAPTYYRGVANPAEDTHQLMFTTTDRAAAQDFASRGGTSGVVQELNVNINKPASVADVVDAARHVFGLGPGSYDATLDAMLSEQVEAVSGRVYGDVPDAMYHPAVLAELQRRGFDGFKGLDNFGRGAIEVAVPFDRSQATAAAIAAIDPKRNAQLGGWSPPPVESFLFPNVQPTGAGTVEPPVTARPLSVESAVQQGSTQDVAPQVLELMRSKQALLEGSVDDTEMGRFSVPQASTLSRRDVHAELQRNLNALGQTKDFLERFASEAASGFLTDPAEVEHNQTLVHDYEEQVNKLLQWHPWLHAVAQIDDAIATAQGQLKGGSYNDYVRQRAQRAETLATKLVDVAGTAIRGDDGRPLTVYHGTGLTLDKLDIGKADPEGLIGPALYYTSHPQIAGGDPLEIIEGQIGGATQFPSGNIPYAHTRAVQARATRQQLEASVVDLNDKIQALQATRSITPPERWKKQMDQAKAELEMAEAKLAEFPEIGAQVRVSHLIANKVFQFDKPISGSEARAILDVALAEPAWKNFHKDWQEYADHLQYLDEQGKLGDSVVLGNNLYHGVAAAVRSDIDPNQFMFADQAGFGKSNMNELLRRVGYDVVEYDGGVRATGMQGVNHRAFAVLNPAAVVEKFAHSDEVMLAAQARGLAVQMTKQLQVLQAPSIEDSARHSEFTDTDVATAAMSFKPGSTVVVKGLIDPSQTLRDLAAGRVSYQGLDAQHYAIVEREGRLDLMLSSREPITKEMIADYQQYGVFKGMRVKTNTKAGATERIVAQVGPNPRGGKLAVEVYEPGAKGIGRRRNGTVGNRPHWVSLDKVITQGDSYHAVDAKALFDEWMAQLPEGADRVKMAENFDSFMESKGITEPALYVGIRAGFDARLIDMYRQSEPDFNAMAEAAADELEAAEAEASFDPSEMEEDALESMAAARAFNLVRVPDGGGWILVDQLSPFKLPIDDNAAAMEFLRNYEREAMDGDPGGQVPIEVAHSIPPTANASTAPSPKREAAQARRSAGRKARVGVAVADGPEVIEDFPTRFEAPPPPAPPGGTGGPPPAGYDLAGLTPHAGDLERLVTSFYHRWLAPVRTTFSDLESKLIDLGFSNLRPWESYTKIANNMDKAHNEAHPYHGALTTAIDHVRSKHVRNGRVWDVLAQSSLFDRQRLVAKFGMTNRESTAIESMISSIHNLLGDDAVEMWPQVLRFVRQTGANQRLKVQDPYGKDSDYPAIRFFVEHSKDAFADFQYPNASQILHSFVKAYTFNKHVASSWNEAKEIWNQVAGYQDYDGSRPLAPLGRLMTDWLDLVRRGHDAGLDLALEGVQTLVNNTVGRLIGPITKSEASDLINGGLSAVYRGIQGFRLFPIIRDSTQPILAMPYVGMKNMARAYATMLRGTAQEKDAVFSKMAEIGVLHKGIPPIDANLVATGEYVDRATRTFTPRERAMRDLRGQIGGFLRDMVPPALRTINGTKIDPMYLYTLQGGYNRIITGWAAHLNFWDSHAKWIAKRQAMVRSGKPDDTSSVDSFIRSFNGDSFDKPIVRALREKITAGDYEGAAALYANEVANATQFRYGTKELPPGWRTHTARIGLQFGNYTMQSMAYLRTVARFASRSLQVRALLTIGAATTALVLAERKTGAKFSKFMWFSPFGFAGGPATKLADVAYHAAQGLAQESTGRLPSTDQQRAMDDLTNPTNWAANFAREANPLGGLLEGYRAVDYGLQSPNPTASLFRYFVTGDKKGGATDWRQHFNDPNQPMPLGGGGNGAF